MQLKLFVSEMSFDFFEQKDHVTITRKKHHRNLPEPNGARLFVHALNQVLKLLNLDEMGGPDECEIL